MVGARCRAAARDSRCRVHESRRPRIAAAPRRPARRRRSDGVLFPQQRSERRLLQRADQSRGLPSDCDHGEKARTEARSTLTAEDAEIAEFVLYKSFSALFAFSAVERPG